MANIFTAWRRQFLGKRGLETPTGHPLYSYRLSAEEFADLEELLKTSLEMYLRTGTLGRVTQQIVYFPSMFVLYAAEWWRRRYDGSGWSWEPILSALEVPSDSWSPVQRSACIERGLREWKLELTTMHGFRFLGSVAFQGGLPMQLLGAARGNIGRVLTRVLRLASTGSVEASDIRGWIRSLSKDLPQAYRQDEIYSLLAEVIFTVLSLKREASLETADGAVAALDRFDSEWRTRFPIPVEDAQAQALIEQLIRDVAVVRFVRSTRKVYVERRLTEIDESNWEMESEIAPSCPCRTHHSPAASAIRPCSGTSRVLQACPTSLARSSSTYVLRLPDTTHRTIPGGRTRDLPVLAHGVSVRARGL